MQNRVALAMPLLPEVVRQTGVTTRKRSPDILMTVSLNSPDRRYDQLYLSNYAADAIARTSCRGCPASAKCSYSASATTACGIWLDPDKLAVARTSK